MAGGAFGNAISRALTAAIITPGEGITKAISATTAGLTALLPNLISAIGMINVTPAR
jgi:hypothetical protein